MSRRVNVRRYVTTLGKFGIGNALNPVSRCVNVRRYVTIPLVSLELVMPLTL